MERGKKRSYNVMDDEPVIYEFSEIEIQNLKIVAEKIPTFSGVENTKVYALKASSFVVSLVPFSGASVVVYASDGSWYVGEIIFSDFFYNLVVDSCYQPGKSSRRGFTACNIPERIWGVTLEGSPSSEFN
ncbi:hypothetical protein OROMI_015421 [Orobanche minor]